MSTLNLTPNPTAVATQAVIFITNLFIVKKLMLEPFLKQKALRDAATTGSQSNARELIETSQKMTEEISRRMQNAHVSIRSEVDEIKKKASDRRQAIISAAETEAKSYIQQIQSEISKGLAEERNKLSASARVLAGQLLDRALI